MSTFETDVLRFVALVTSGRSVEAMEQFFTDDVEMRENYDPPRVGKAFNLEHERRNLASTQRPPTIEARAVTFNAEANVSMIEWHITFVTGSGKAKRVEEVAVQRWRDGKICAERFFYGGLRDLTDAK
jgi:ketosteroid isomerase-like protein